MKILFLIEQLSGGGKERRLVELLKGLNKQDDFEIHLVLAKNKIDYPEVKQLSIKIHQLPNSSNIGLMHTYYLKIKEIQPQVIHSWSYKSSFYLALLKPFFNFKFIAGFIGDTFGFSKKLSFVARHLIFKKANVIISNSQKGLEAYQVPKNKGKVIYNGFNPNRISRSKTNILENLGIISPIKVVMLANVSPYKNYELFINIAEHFVAKRDDITFLAIGKILPEFENLVSPYVNDKHSQIKFLGFRSDANELIKDCDIGLLCTYTEGISNAIIELMANGVPVITNDLKGGSTEIISNGIDGFICNNEEMIDTIDTLLKDENLRKKISLNAKNKIHKVLTLSKMVNDYAKIYRLN